MNNILFIGGSGFIGSSTVELFIKKNINVDVLTQGYSQNNLKKTGVNVIKIKYDEFNFHQILSKKKYSTVYIFNGNPHPINSFNNPSFDIEFLINPLLSILEALRKVNYKGVIWFSSSVAVYGSSSGVKLKESFETKPISPYGISKDNAEKYCKYYSKEYGLKIGILRLFSTYGPNLKRQVVFDLFNKISKNPKELVLTSKVGDSRDMSFVEDMARAIVFLNENLVPNGDIINIGSGKETQIIEIAKIISKVLNYSGEIKYADISNSYDGTSWVADISKLKKINFNYNYDIESGLIKTIKSWKVYEKD